MISSTTAIHAQLQQAFRVLQAGHPADCERKVRLILATHPKEANSLHLLGLSLKQQGKLDDAQKALKSALNAGGKKDEITVSLAGIHYSLGQYQSALDLYDTVLHDQPGHADARYNSALSAASLGQTKEAIQHTDIGAKHHPHDPRFRFARAFAHEKASDFDQAIRGYSDVASLQPDHFLAHYNLARLLQEGGKLDKAKTHAQAALRVAPKSVDAWFILANIQYQLGEADEAELTFRRVLTLAPDHLETHRVLNGLYFEFGFTDKFAKSFAIGRSANPSSLPLRLLEIDTLLQAETFGQCSEAIEQTATDFGITAELSVRQGMLKARLKDMDAAVAHLATAYTAEPDNPGIAFTYARYLIANQNHGTAFDVLDHLENIAPYDQNLWALRGIAWECAGDHKKADWLFNYDKLVTTEILQPEGIPLDQFLSQLRDRLITMHKATHAPMNQTLRHGTQSVGNLLEVAEPEIVAYKKALQGTIQKVIARLPDDSEHPFLQRKPKQFRFSSSWSVRLTEKGFHVNHIHPQGWLSSAFYVTFDPQTVSTDEKDPAGWLQVGSPGLELAQLNIAPRKLIKPIPGMLALFPSYCWHGTFPIRESGERLTAPFDIVPR